MGKETLLNDFLYPLPHTELIKWLLLKIGDSKGIVKWGTSIVYRGNVYGETTTLKNFLEKEVWIKEWGVQIYNWISFPHGTL